MRKLGKLDQRWVEVIWAVKAEGSDEHIGLDHRGARTFNQKNSLNCHKIHLKSQAHLIS